MLRNWKKCLAAGLIFLLLPISVFITPPSQAASEPAVTAKTPAADTTAAPNNTQTQRIAIEKKWVDKDNAEKKRPDKVTVDLKYGTDVHATVVLSKDNAWQHAWQDLKLETKDKKWTVVERPVTGYVATQQETCLTDPPPGPNAPCLNKKIVLTNTLKTAEPVPPAQVVKPLSIALKAKVLLDEATPANDAFTVILKDASGQVLQSKTNTGDTVSFDPLSVEKPGTFIYTIAEVQKTAPDLVYAEAVYEARVVAQEKNGTLVADVQYLKDGIPSTGTPTFYNVTKKTESLTVKKIWEDPGKKDSNPPNEAKVQLYKNKQAEGNAVALNEANNWQHTFENLPSGFDWTVDEVAVPANYTKKVAVDGTTVTIINTFTEENKPAPVDPAKKPTVTPKPAATVKPATTARPTTTVRPTTTARPVTTTRTTTTTKAPARTTTTTRKPVPRTGHAVSSAAMILPVAGLVIGVGGVMGVGLRKGKK